MTAVKTFTTNHVEGINYVTCQICGRRLKKITNSHLRTHDLTSAEYQNLYPDAQMISDLTRKKLSEANTGKKASVETKVKMSEAKAGEKHPLYGKPVSVETRQKISEANKGRIISDEIKQKISESLSGKNHPLYGMTGEKHPRYGKSPSIETKKKLSETRKEGFRTGRIKISKKCGSSKSGYRPDLGHSVRSTWEANIARILNLQGIKWQYEPQRFDLGDCTYLPDFHLPDEDKWIEVKGYMRDQDEQKIHMFGEMGYNLILIDKPAYKQLEKEYKSLIPEWESKKNTNIVRRIRVRGRAIKGNFTYRNVKKLFRRSKLKC